MGSPPLQEELVRAWPRHCHFTVGEPTEGGRLTTLPADHPGEAP
jgi:hypothetical protein